MLTLKNIKSKNYIYKILDGIDGWMDERHAIFNIALILHIHIAISFTQSKEKQCGLFS